jgi:ABC-2 type transport system ATP-binding protein
VRNFIEELRGQGRTIFICTHNLTEADRLCDRIGIFKSHLIEIDTPENLREKFYGHKVVFHLRQLDPAWLAPVRAIPGVKDVQQVEQKLVVGLDEPEKLNPEIIRILVGAGADIQFVGEVRHSLEDVYIQTLQEAEEEAVTA